jgi:hypothetical protein
MGTTSTAFVATMSMQITRIGACGVPECGEGFGIIDVSAFQSPCSPLEGL